MEIRLYNNCIQDLRFSQRRLWRVSSSGVWRRVVRWVAPDISEELIASIFRVEEIGSANQGQAECSASRKTGIYKETKGKFAEPIPFTLKMEAISSSEKLGATQWTTRRHIPEDDTLHNHRCENLKSYIENTSFFWTYSSTLNMEALCSSETSVTFYQATHDHFSEWNYFYNIYYS
jgi:hypothetical protein